MLRQNLQRSGLLGSSRMTIQLFGLVFFATITMAAFGSQSVGAIDGTGIRGGTQAPGTRYDCRQLCTKPVGPGCVQFIDEGHEPCGKSTLGLVCGYQIEDRKSILECYERPNGPYPAPCPNDAPLAPCYKTYNCICQLVGYHPSGEPIYACIVNRRDKDDSVYVTGSSVCVDPV